MKPRTCYTIGYRQHNASVMLQHLIEWGVVIVDIRLKPYSRYKPFYNKNAMLSRYPESYIHIEDLGNTAYLDKLGYIALKNKDAGIPLVFSQLAKSDVCLMCACAAWSSCHRHKVAELLLEQQHDLRVIHIDEEHNVRSTWENGEVVNQWTQEPLIIEE